MIFPIQTVQTFRSSWFLCQFSNRLQGWCPRETPGPNETGLEGRSWETYYKPGTYTKSLYILSHLTSTTSLRNSMLSPHIMHDKTEARGYKSKVSKKKERMYFHLLHPTENKKSVFPRYLNEWMFLLLWKLCKIKNNLDTIHLFSWKPPWQLLMAGVLLVTALRSKQPFCSCCPVLPSKLNSAGPEHNY